MPRSPAHSSRASGLFCLHLTSLASGCRSRGGVTEPWPWEVTPRGLWLSPGGSPCQPGKSPLHPGRPSRLRFASRGLRSAPTKEVRRKHLRWPRWPPRSRSSHSSMLVGQLCLWWLLLLLLLRPDLHILGTLGSARSETRVRPPCCGPTQGHRSRGRTARDGRDSGVASPGWCTVFQVPEAGSVLPSYG